MTINCPPCCTAQSCVLSHDGPCDSPTVQMDSTTNSASHQTTCPDLDPSSSTDSTQTHDSLVTPESPHYSPSPCESLEEGITQVRTTQDRTDSLAYDSLITTLSRLSLKPEPDPLSDHHYDPFPLHPDLDPIGSSDRTLTHPWWISTYTSLVTHGLLVCFLVLCGNRTAYCTDMGSCECGLPFLEPSNISLVLKHTSDGGLAIG